MSAINDLGVVIVAAGSSSRFGQEDKLMLTLNGMPLFLNSIKTFSELLPLANIVVVTSPERTEKFKNIIKEQLNLDLKVIAGGKERKDSSLNGLKNLPASLKYAAVHDGARPYISLTAIQNCYSALLEHNSAVLAHPVTDTIKVINENGMVDHTPPRNRLYAAETPQMFIRKDLISAYENNPNQAATDESMAMELAGHKVFLVIHEEDNRKITYPKDLI